MDVTISTNGCLITIASHNYRLTLDMAGVVINMRKKDFNKMLSVVGHMLYPDDFYCWLMGWHDYLSAAAGRVPRADIFLAKIEQRIERLPGWVFDEL